MRHGKGEGIVSTNNKSEGHFLVTIVEEKVDQKKIKLKLIVRLFRCKKAEERIKYIQKRLSEKLILTMQEPPRKLGIFSVGM